MNSCVICGESISTPRTNDDWQSYQIPHAGPAHFSCHKIIDEIKTEEAKAEIERLIKLARERLT